MRIVMIGQKGLPAHSGGVERHVEDLATRLASAGHEVFVYCRKSYAKGSAIPKTYQGVRCIPLPTIPSKHLETPLHTLIATLHALFLQPDIIHFHGIGPSLWAWIPRMCAPSVHIVSTFHCQDYFHQKWGAAARLVFRVGEVIACTVVHQTIVVSRTLERYVGEKYGRQTLYIPNAVALPREISASHLETFGLVPHRYLLSVSRLVKHKGIHHIIRAYMQARTRHALPPLVIVGDSSFTDEYVASLKALASSLPHDILFLGEQSGDSLHALYRYAQLFIQASESEGLSYTLLEAMSAGCPILASDIIENREVLPISCTLFRSGDVSDLANKLITLHQCAPSSQQVSIYQQHVQREYNADITFPQTLSLYRDLSHS